MLHNTNFEVLDVNSGTFLLLTFTKIVSEEPGHPLAFLT